jgi:hypothetical protein
LSQSPAIGTPYVVSQFSAGPHGNNILRTSRKSFKMKNLAKRWKLKEKIFDFWRNTAPKKTPAPKKIKTPHRKKHQHRENKKHHTRKNTRIGKIVPKTPKFASAPEPNLA